MIPPELIPDAAPLSGLPGLDGARLAILESLWIDTAEQFVGIYGTNEATRARLSSTLRIDRTGLDYIVNAAQRLSLRSRSDERGPEIRAPSSDSLLGALLEDPAVTAARSANLAPYASPVRAALPQSHSLLDQLPPLRSQGKRPTCVAYAVLALREQLEVAAGAPLELDLSEQYVYWWCKQFDGLPGRSATYLSTGMRCLNESGAPFESQWPYVAVPDEDLSQGPQPGTADGDPGFCTSETQEFNRTDVAGMKACLVEGRSIAFSLPVFDSWFKSSASARWGKITIPLPGEPMREGHAMAIVGYQDDARAPGGGYFLVRNSWQPWAWDGAWQPGYGYIPYAYVSHHASTVFSARRALDGHLLVRGKQDGSLIVGSPDVWLRQSHDAGTEPQAAQAGRESALYVRLTNVGPTYLYGVRGEVYFERDGSLAWERAGVFAEPWLRPGETVLGPLAWIAPSSDRFAFAVRLL